MSFSLVEALAFFFSGMALGMVYVYWISLRIFLREIAELKRNICNIGLGD